MQQEIWVGASVAMLGIATLLQWRKIVRGAKPAGPIGWFIWSVVSFVTLAALIKAGATPLQLLIPLSQLLSTATLFIVTSVVILRRKLWRDPDYLRFKDWKDGLAALAWCIGGVSVWISFGLDYPMIAIVGNVAANFAGLIPMLREAWKFPQTTTPSYWACRGISSIFATLEFLERFNLAGLIPQLTGLIIAGSMLAVYLARQRRKPVVAELSY